MMIDEDLPDLSLCSICVPRQRQQLSTLPSQAASASYEVSRSPSWTDDKRMSDFYQAHCIHAWSLAHGWLPRTK